MTQILISADEAPKAITIIDLLKELGIPYEIASISFDLGDYIINGWVDERDKPHGAALVERVTVPDMWGKMKSGRGNNQMVDLSSSIRLSILAVIGYLELDLADQIKTDYSHAMASMLAESVSIVWKRANIDIHETFTGGGNVSLINFTNEYTFVLFLKELLKWCQIEDPRIPRIERLSKRPEWQYLFWLQSISGVGELLSRTLAFEFPVPYDLVTASKERLLEVEGVGKGRANMLYNFFRNKQNIMY